MPRLTKIYTRTGDDGYTNFGKKRISKDSLIIEALGNIDELNAYIGLVIAHIGKRDELHQFLTAIQNDLFDLGGELYFPENTAISADKVTFLEKHLDQWNEQLPSLKEFVLPSGSTKIAILHIARTVCRRAERSLVHLHQNEPLSNVTILKYINRLSDTLFVLARFIAHEEHTNEILWNH